MGQVAHEEPRHLFGQLLRGQRTGRARALAEEEDLAQRRGDRDDAEPHRDLRGTQPPPSQSRNAAARSCDTTTSSRVGGASVTSSRPLPARRKRTTASSWAMSWRLTRKNRAGSRAGSTSASGWPTRYCSPPRERAKTTPWLVKR